MNRYKVHAECSCDECVKTLHIYTQNTIVHFTLDDQNGRWVRYEDVKNLEEELFELMEFKNAVMTLIKTREK